MANTDAAFGFRPIRRLDGSAWTGNLTQRAVPYNGAALNRGDVVKNLSTGYVGIIAAGNTDHQAVGVFMGCHYTSSALGYSIWSNYWPGSGGVGTLDVDAFICDDPNVVYEVQSSGTAIAFADIGFGADVVVNASTTGFSKWTINQATLNTTATFPWRIVGLGNRGVNVGPGYDTATSYNIVEVAWNDHAYKQFAAI